METTLGQRIAERRKLLGLSQEGLGDKMGVSRQAISKWEADAAVPEIDKLIALSKLFEVSIGWLLGTETESDAHANPGFTEQQLKMVDEIVRRYYKPVQPEAPKKSGWRWVGYLCTGLALLIAVVTLMGISAEVQQHTHQITGVQSGYSSIQNALGLLSDRLDALANGEKLLENFTFDAVPFEDWTGADVSFSTVPKGWREGDTAYLVVRLGDQEIYRTACSWDGSSCTAQLSMNARNGYKICYLVIHTDGTQEQQMLEDIDIQYLKDSLRLNCSATCNLSVSVRKLTAENLHLGVKLPRFSHDGTIECSAITWVIRYNGEEIHKEAVRDSPLLTGGGSYSSTGKETFSLPAPSNGDGFTVCIEVTLSNGLQSAEELGAWKFENNLWRPII